MKLRISVPELKGRGIVARRQNSLCNFPANLRVDERARRGVRVPYVVRICIRHGKSEGRKEKNRVIKRDFPYSSFTASKAHENSPPPPLRSSPQPPSLVRSPAVEAWTQTDRPRDGSQSRVGVAAQNRRDRKQIQSLKKCARQPAPARDPNPCKFKTPFLRVSRCETLWSPAAASASVPPFDPE